MAGVNALQAWAVHAWIYGLAWSAIAVLYFGATLQAIASLYQQFKAETSTNFSGADLSHAHWQD
ncbi:MAG: hypothetical protein HC810_06940 [Acaryochloridaceae cyanobacterium RL_2_7]|nr:hypothetical protein [Acaryochloridaceae cyanobacterium RL_2_7]